jgi:acetyl-CoA carboxylase biotin carboxyl carrier protein
MDLTQEDVLQILKIMDESDYGELHLRVGDLKLDVNKNGNPGLSPGDGSPPVQTPVDVPKKAEKRVQNNAPAGESDSKEDAEIVDESYAAKGLIPVRSPMLGTFYTSPKPGDPAFVEEGQVVDEDTTVCIIEVMKLFSTIHAGVKGRIAKICANDSQMVEYDQVLFLIEPEADQGEG